MRKLSIALVLSLVASASFLLAGCPPAVTITATADPASLVVTGDDLTTTITITNTGEAAIDWTATLPEGVTADVETGTLEAGASADVVVTIAGTLAAGTVTVTIANDADAQQSVDVDIALTAPEGENTTEVKANAAVAF